MIDFLNFNKAV